MRITEIAVVLVIVAAMAGLTYRAVTSFLIRRELDAARRENEELKARRAVLLEDAFRLGARATELLEREPRAPMSAGRDRVSRAQGPGTPSRNAGHETIVAWLSSKGAQLQAIAVELSDGNATAGVEQGSAAARNGGCAASTNGDDAPRPTMSHSAQSRSVGKATQ